MPTLFSTNPSATSPNSAWHFEELLFKRWFEFGKKEALFGVVSFKGEVIWLCLSVEVAVGVGGSREAIG